jgi:hypothetical protein
MSELTEVQTLLSAVAQMGPAARAWVEERLVRGTPEGGIAGAHVIFGVELTDPMGGKTRTTKGPYAIDVTPLLAGQPAADWASVTGQLELQQQATIAEQGISIAGLTADLATQTALVATRDGTISTLTAERDALAAQVTTLTEQLAAATTPPPVDETAPAEAPAE